MGSEMCIRDRFNPHHSWTTMRPGPEPEVGTARYPEAVVPLLVNSTVVPMAGA